MLTSLILQLLIDVLLVSAIVWIWLLQKRHLLGGGRVAFATSYEQKILESEKAIVELRGIIEMERRKIQALHDHIRSLMDQGMLTSTIFPMSQEEEELKSLSMKPAKEEVIPSLKQFEITRERISKEGVLDLRTILRDQLA